MSTYQLETDMGDLAKSRRTSANVYFSQAYCYRFIVRRLAALASTRVCGALLPMPSGYEIGR